MIQMVAAALLAVALTGAGSYAYGYISGRAKASRACKVEALQAQVDALSAELAREYASDQAAALVRNVVQQHTQEIHVDTATSVQIVRADWGRAVCALPERVRSELQARIDQANAAARGL